MAHVLARIQDVNVKDLRARLEADAAEHAREGLHLERLWTNADAPSQVYFLFRADDLARVRRFIEGRHAKARAADPDANLPLMTYLEES